MSINFFVTWKLWNQSAPECLDVFPTPISKYSRRKKSLPPYFVWQNIFASLFKVKEKSLLPPPFFGKKLLSLLFIPKLAWKTFLETTLCINQGRTGPLVHRAVPGAPLQNYTRTPLESRCLLLLCSPTAGILYYFMLWPIMAPLEDAFTR